MYPVGIHVATRSFKLGAVRRIDFEKKWDFRQKIWKVSPLGEFSPQKKKSFVGASSRVKNSLPRQELTYANYSRVVFLLF